MASISRGSKVQDLPRRKGVGTSDDDGTDVGGRNARRVGVVEEPADTMTECGDTAELCSYLKTLPALRRGREIPTSGWSSVCPLVRD